MILAPNMQKILKHGGRNIPPLTARKEFINKNNEKDDLRFFGDSLVRRTSIYSAGKRKEGMAGQKASPSFAGHDFALRRGTTKTFPNIGLTYRLENSGTSKQPIRIRITRNVPGDVRLSTALRRPRKQARMDKTTETFEREESLKNLSLE